MSETATAPTAETSRPSAIEMVNDIRNPATTSTADSDPNNATPIMLPACLAVFRVPEEIPVRLRSTLPRSAEVIAGTMSPRPRRYSVVGRRRGAVGTR